MFGAIAQKDLFSVGIHFHIYNLFLVFQNILPQRYILVSSFCGI